MATYTYPRSDLDRSQVLLGLLGSHWSATYGGSAVVESYAFARGQEEAQTHLDLLEAIASVCRFDVPIFHTDAWFLLTLLESELNGEKVAVVQYGTEIVYANQPDTGIEHKYGTLFGTPLHSFPAPAELKEAKLIFNRLMSPSISMVGGIDFQFDSDRAAIHFRRNPFDDPLVPKRNIYQGGQITDREAGLWVFRGQFDWEHAYTHFGYVLGLRMASSEGFRNLINGIFNALAEGSNYRAIAMVLSAITAVPLVIEAEETVEDTWLEPNYRIVATDQHVYRFNPIAEPVVSAGDTVQAGDVLTDAFKIYEFTRGQVDGDLHAIALDRRLLVEGYYDGVTFTNAEVPLVVDTSGIFTKVSFELGGWPGDVEKFFNDFHERGIAKGQTLAHLLDQRTNKVGEPTAAAFPSTINPLEFLAENVLRNNFFMVKLKPQRFGNDSLDLGHMRELRKILPPHTGFILLVELDVPGDVVIIVKLYLHILTHAQLVLLTMDELCTMDLEEGITSYRASETISDTIGIAMASDPGPTPRLRIGICCD